MISSLVLARGQNCSKSCSQRGSLLVSANGLFLPSAEVFTTSEPGGIDVNAERGDSRSLGHAAGQLGGSGPLPYRWPLTGAVPIDGSEQRARKAVEKRYVCTGGSGGCEPEWFLVPAELAGRSRRIPFRGSINRRSARTYLINPDFGIGHPSTGGFSANSQEILASWLGSP